MNHRLACRRQQGFSMIEVLVTLVILLFGLLGLVGLQSRAQLAETESYQRTQALVLLRDIAERLSANRPSAGAYVFGVGVPLGNGSTKNCAAPATQADIDLCQWDAALKGAAETTGGACALNGSNCIGAMIGARGCITSTGTDQYLIQVAWQGMVRTAAPPGSVACGSGSYSDESQRRAVTTVVEFGAIA